MKTLHRKLLWASLIITMSQQAQSQDIHFSQFNEAPLLRNPALAGIFTGDLRFQAVYRTQWQSVTVPYQTTSLNGEFKLPVGKGEDFLTLGAQILYDKAGSIGMTSTHILPAVNYHKSLSGERNMYLSLGFMGGMVQRRFDRSKITTNSQFDGTNYNPGLSDGESFDKSSYSYFDGTVGMSFNAQLNDNPDNNVFAGIAFHHFNKPSNISFYGNTKLEMIPKWVYSGGARLATSELTYVTFHADYSKQGPYSELIGGAIYTWKLDDEVDPKYLIHGGAFLRMNDAVIPVAKVEMRPLAISVSYDANISKLSATTRGRGGFELALTYQTYLDRDNTSRNAVRCPRF
ncbi:MAG: PorP/SprF family type IX secretion system membrane protein [Chitinophagaceae bacterium]|nr:PorP/SprF family type IX secretion system membrane protein [Chitinophagaceae bacterium]